MIGRTMSHLFLTVVAAAIFLVSGCVPPIDAPDSGEQVRAVEAERIEKLEQAVAEAVAAVKPAELAKRVAHAVEADEQLRNRIINSLCNNRVTLKLIDVDQAFVNTVSQKLTDTDKKLTPTQWITRGQGTYEFEYTDLSKKQFDTVSSVIGTAATKGNGSIQVVLDEEQLWKSCGQLDEQTGALVYVSVSGIPGGEVGRDYALSIQIEFVNPFQGSRVWFVPQKGHWLEEAANKYMSDQKKRKKILQIFGATNGIEITDRGSAGGKWNGNKWTWEVTANISKPPEELIQLSVPPENLITGNTAVYAMVARKVRRDVAGKSKIFRVVQYRIFKIDSPARTFKDQLIKLEDALRQPACPPSSDIQHGNAQSSFRTTLKAFYPKEPCKQ